MYYIAYYELLNTNQLHHTDEESKDKLGKFAMIALLDNGNERVNVSS